MAKKKAIDPNRPVMGDDAGNLTKAGYTATDMAKAKKLYEKELKERPLEMGDTTFSEYLYEQAALAYIIEFGGGLEDNTQPE